MRLLSLIFLFHGLLLGGCGKIEETKKKFESGLQLPLAPVGSGATTTQAIFSPGSFFKVLKEVDTAKDTRVIEIQLLSSGQFLMTHTSFPGGNLTQGSVQKKSGFYQEASGRIDLTINYDSCGLKATTSVSFSGDKKDIVYINYGGNHLKFYSYLKYVLPSDIAGSMSGVIEDVGCKKFKAF